MIWNTTMTAMGKPAVFFMDFDEYPDSIDTIMLKIYYYEYDRMFLKFDMSLDFTEHELDLMADRLDKLIMKLYTG
jgi:uncharacterized protein YqkB